MAHEVIQKDEVPYSIFVFLYAKRNYLYTKSHDVAKA